MAISSTALEGLLESANPLHWAWQQLVHLYTPATPPADVVAFYDEKERDLCAFEEALYRCYFEFYDLLLDRSLSADEELGPAWFFERSDFVIVADSLSVREALLLKLFLPRVGPYETQEIDYFCAPFPTETRSLAQLLLGVPSPAQGRDTSSFSYRYVPGPGATPHLPYSGDLLVWLRLPDVTLEEVRAAQTRTVQDALDDTIRALTAILQRSGRKDALLISDHGYLYARTTDHYWPFPEGIRSKVQRLFGKARRMQEEPDKVEQIRDFGAPEPYRRRFVFEKGCAALLGRYWWASGASDERLAAHGGFSLPEVLVPMLRIRVGG